MEGVFPAKAKAMVKEFILKYQKELEEMYTIQLVKEKKDFAFIRNQYHLDAFGEEPGVSILLALLF